MIIYDPILKIFRSSFLNNESFQGGFSTKMLGDGRKSENIIKFFKSNNIPFKKMILLEQIHSVNIATYQSQNDNEIEIIEETDGVVTNESNVLLIVRTGDCVPIQFYDRKNNIIGISHQGWRGSVKQMVRKMIQAILDLGAQLSSIHLAIGPCIGQCCYEISDDLYYEFMETLDGYSDKIFTQRHGKWYLNLLLLNYLLALNFGIDKKHIDFFPFCTKCDDVRFFSFRRDKKADYGEMFSYIMKRI
ncbi:MAG: peptidoglycan editing factor PgeF [bacterium]|nr:peptidoglycan editing factor PgeF [bacterium]